MSVSSRGFTLVELMIVVAVIGVLAGMALPAYSAYRIRAAENSCLAEAKNYAQFALAAIYSSAAVSSPVRQACLSMEAATAFGVDITAQPQSPGVRGVTCDMETAVCSLDP